MLLTQNLTKPPVTGTTIPPFYRGKIHNIYLAIFLTIFKCAIQWH